MNIASSRVLQWGKSNIYIIGARRSRTRSTDAVTWETRFAWNTAQDRLSRRDKSNGVEISNGNLTSISSVLRTCYSVVASVSLSTPLIRGSQIPKYCPGLPVDHQSLGETSSDLVGLDYQLASSSSGEAGRLRIFRKGSLQSMILDANPTSRHPSSFWPVHFPMQRTDPV